jgi:hypothetical protein
MEKLVDKRVRFWFIFLNNLRAAQMYQNGHVTIAEQHAAKG